MADDLFPAAAEPVVASPAAPVPPLPDAVGQPQSQPPAQPPVEADSAATAPARQLTLLEQYDARKAAADAADEAKRVEDLAKLTKPEETPKPPEIPKIEQSAKTEEKPAEPPKIEEKPGEIEKPAEKHPETQAEAAAPFAFTEFSIPDDFVKEYEQGKDRIAALRDILTKPEINPQERGQALLDMHAEAMRAYATEVQDRQQEVWKKYQTQEQIDAMSDPVVGGPRFETSMGIIARVRDRGLNTQEERDGLNEWLNRTGAGSNRWFLRWAYNLSRFVNEQDSMPTNIKPPPDAGQRPGRKSSVLYDNPRS